MSIRLNKAIKEFGVGLQSITDLLKEKGAPVPSNDPNQKLDEKQYELLKRPSVPTRLCAARPKRRCKTAKRKAISIGQESQGRS